jgi:TPP-dependent 2-oxoacid decarboxylase
MFGCYYGSYLANKLAQIGVCHGFAVAGDYNLSLLDQYSNITEEFNAENGSGRGAKAANGLELPQAIAVELSNKTGPTLNECILDRANRDDCTQDDILGKLVAK